MAKEWKMLPQKLDRQLAQIEPSHCESIKYFPCDVVLNNGTLVERVVFTSAAAYIKYWGVYPDSEQGKRAVELEEVESVHDSVYRLPAKFANELYKHG